VISKPAFNNSRRRLSYRENAERSISIGGSTKVMLSPVQASRRGST
jgi:hypothetical protein